MPKNPSNGKRKKLCLNADIAEIIGAITKRGVTDKQLAVYFYETYEDFAKKHDNLGRTALHLAASCGRIDLCKWLINVAGANINAKDWESGYTPLHRAIFYGHICCTVRLLQMGADPLLIDKEGLTSLDLVIKDRSLLVQMSSKVSCQVYVWGSNDNYTLGTGTNKARKVPELLNFVDKNFSFKQICMSEYHSVFVTSCSKVWVCGNGRGGRLGYTNERQVLTPRPLGIGGESCVMAATALNHTVILLSNGSVLACGQNENYQLGVNPNQKECLSLKPVLLKHTTEQILGICAGKYHSVFYGKVTLFTCGLNGGQLGHPQLENCPHVKIPTQVPIILKTGSYITNVASNSSCVVFSLSTGEIYTLYQFKFSKIASKQLDVCQIATSGGSFDSKTITENNGALKVVLLTLGGTIQIWQETNPHLKRCMLGLNRLISINYIFLTDSKILFTTKSGEAYQGTIGQLEKLPVTSSSSEGKSGFHKFIEKSECYNISAHRIKNIHRAIAITSDPKGKNMAVIQTHPHNALTDIPVQNTNNITVMYTHLLEESSETDYIHDIVFKVDKKFFPAHEYIISCNSSSFLSLPRQGKIVEISDIHPVIFKEILYFMYTGWCTILDEGSVILGLSSPNDDPVKLLTEACNKYKISTLYKKITCYRYLDGCVKLKENSHKPDRTPCEFSRDLFPELYDVQVSSEDGKSLKAHKCILVARLEYFQSMLMGGWLESVSTPTLHLDCPSSTLELFLNYVYTNKIPESLHTEGFESITRLLMLSDQMLCKDLKESCELTLVSTLSLKNAPSMLQLAYLYNSAQLKRTVMQFISLNLETIIENRSLEDFNDEILLELGEYHRRFNCEMYDKRIITPFFDHTIKDEVILSCNSDSWPENILSPNKDQKDNKNQTKNVQGSQKKKTPKKSFEGIPDDSETKESEVHTFLPQKETSPISIGDLSPEEISVFGELDFCVNDNFSWSRSKKHQKAKYEIPKRFVGVPFRKLVKDGQVKVVEPVTPEPKFKGWAVISPPNPPENINRNESVRPPIASNFVDIIQSEQQAKNDYFKMKEKSFMLTQMEDKAIEDLNKFYNASNIFDERITVLRVTSRNIPKPTWIKNNKTLFH